MAFFFRNLTIDKIILDVSGQVGRLHFRGMLIYFFGRTGMQAGLNRLGVTLECRLGKDRFLSNSVTEICIFCISC